MFPIKFSTKHIFRNFYILKINNPCKGHPSLRSVAVNELRLQAAALRSHYTLCDEYRDYLYAPH